MYGYVKRSLIHREYEQKNTRLSDHELRVCCLDVSWWLHSSGLRAFTTLSWCKKVRVASHQLKPLASIKSYTPAHENRVKSTTPVGLRVTKRDRGVWAPAAGRVCDGGGFVLPTIAGEILLSKGRKFLDSVYKQKNTHAHTRKRPGMFPIKGVASTATSPDIWNAQLVKKNESCLRFNFSTVWEKYCTPMFITRKVFILVHACPKLKLIR